MSDNTTTTASTANPEIALVAISVMLIVMQWLFLEARRLWKVTMRDPEPGKQLDFGGWFILLYAGGALLGVGSAFISGYALFGSNDHNTALAFAIACLFFVTWLLLLMAPFLVIDDTRTRLYRVRAVVQAWGAHAVFASLALGVAFAMQPILDRKKDMNSATVAMLAFMMAILVALVEGWIIDRMVAKWRSERPPRSKTD